MSIVQKRAAFERTRSSAASKTRISRTRRWCCRAVDRDGRRNGRNPLCLERALWHHEGRFRVDAGRRRALHLIGQVTTVAMR